MRLGRAAAYATFAVVYIAENLAHAPIQGKDIAKTCGMPGGRLLKILQQLVRARILASERGPAGGFRLRKPPAEVTVLEIIEAVEGPIDGDMVVIDGVGNMDRAKEAVHAACAEVAEFARNRLRSISIQELLR
jgi:Rrf2 family protein